MKAEHRKELETNVLADKVGRMVQGMKTAPQKRLVLYLILGAAVVLVLVFFLRSRRLRQEESAELWREFENGSFLHMQRVKSHENTTQAKAARFQEAWINLWDNGIKKLGLVTSPAHPPGFEALIRLEESEREYEALAKESKGDPILHPEALFCLALIEETRMAVDRANWKKAVDAYEQVVKEYKDSSFGKLAQKRIESLSEWQGDGDQKKRILRPEVEAFYDQMQKDLRLKPLGPLGGGGFKEP